ncbi:MAG TPA: SDR family oxidoreductase [Chryseosolibacter sp.]|nr:SDR family oxidoreductase [Chryseosolibacter sp.]
MRKLIVVTGGSQGIGRAILSKFVAEGFDAVTCARHEADLRALKIEIENLNPGSTIFFQKADLSVSREAKAFAGFVVSLNRPVDVLVNNAGYFVPGDISSEPEGNLESMIEANLYSAYHTTRGLVSEIKKSDTGHIFNMCSIASIQAYDNGGSYAISKFALLGFSKCLREELKSHRIRVTAVLPGATKTRSWEGAGLPDERFIRVEDIAATVYSAWALSPRSVVEEIIIRPMEGDI